MTTSPSAPATSAPASSTGGLPATIDEPAQAAGPPAPWATAKRAGDEPGGGERAGELLDVDQHADP